MSEETTAKGLSVSTKSIWPQTKNRKNMGITVRVQNVNNIKPNKTGMGREREREIKKCIDFLIF